MSYEAVLLLLPNGAGGYARNADRARAIASRLDLHGWILGCRFHGYCRGQSPGHYRRKHVTAALLDTIGQPDRGALMTALAAAGKRHLAVFDLIAAVPVGASDEARRSADNALAAAGTQDAAEAHHLPRTAPSPEPRAGPAGHLLQARC